MLFRKMGSTGNDAAKCNVMFSTLNSSLKEYVHISASSHISPDLFSQDWTRLFVIEPANTRFLAAQKSWMKYFYCSIWWWRGFFFKSMMKVRISHRETILEGKLFFFLEKSFFQPSLTAHHFLFYTSAVLTGRGKQIVKIKPFLRHKLSK